MFKLVQPCVFSNLCIQFPFYVANSIYGKKKVTYVGITKASPPHTKKSSMTMFFQGQYDVEKNGATCLFLKKMPI